jgi:acetyl esterase/lipase
MALRLGHRGWATKVTKKVGWKMNRTLAVVLLATSAAGTAWGQVDEAKVQTKKGIVYAVHDGVSLLGDMYRPTNPGPHAAMMFIHGGGLTGGSRSGYGATWGPYLASRGYVVFAIDYRLGKPKESSWPQALLDCKAGLQYLRGNAAALDVDPEQIGVGGDSAGALLTAMVAVTQDWPAYANQYPGDAYPNVSTKVKVAMPAYGIFDTMVSEKYTLIARDNPPYDWAFGGTPYQLPGVYFEASAIGYIREASKSLGRAATPNLATTIPWFVSYGMVDPRVPPEGESIPFVKALREAGADVTVVPVPDAGHLWFTQSAITGQQGDPSCTQTGSNPFSYVCKGATPNDFVAPQLLDFLAHKLSATLESSAQ